MNRNLNIPAHLPMNKWMGAKALCRHFDEERVKSRLERKLLMTAVFLAVLSASATGMESFHVWVAQISHVLP
ncbi:MAG: hypothetical protein JOZ43_05355 [Acidobacteriales bacterium]|nr:hypothetical protein [Terriglobales bacterium]